jgi:hypothetical protein
MIQHGQLPLDAVMNASHATRGAHRRSRLWRDPAFVIMLALAAVLTLGLHAVFAQPDHGVDRAALAAAIGID